MNRAINKLTRLMKARKENGDAPYVLLLGSSLSLTPAVRRDFAGTDDWQQFWQEMQRASPTERKALLKSALDKLGLAASYRALMQLAKAGYFEVILTLNVDDAVDDAARALPADQCALVIYDGANAEQVIETLSRAAPRLKIIKLRGDINAQALPLTAEGQFEFPDKLERAVSMWLERDAILVGDMPHDLDMQRCVNRGSSSLWCVLPAEETGGFTKRARKARPTGETITGADAEFNTFFATLARELAITHDAANQTTLHNVGGEKEPMAEPQIKLKVLKNRLTDIRSEYDRSNIDVGRYNAMAANLETQIAELEAQVGSSAAPPPSSSPHTSNPKPGGPRADLEAQIREAYEFIRDYEDTRRYGNDPKEIARAKRQIEKQWAYIREKLDEYLPRYGADMPEDIRQIVERAS